ncbi:MAG: hypothetical protein HGA44_07025, partial [Cellulomonadaceae bacterium]|nr:hypothetical protein [Cellulomonadaceae bacterium]
MTADRRRWQLSEAPDPQPLPVRILLWLTVATMAAFVGLLLVQGPGTSFVRDTVLYGVVQWATALLVLARGVIVARERMIWLALGAGMALAAGGDLLWSTSIANLGDGSGPTIADALYLAFYPGCYLALVLIMRLRVTGLPRSLWLDGLTAALALGGVLAALVYGPVAAGADGSPLALATALAYPLL